MSVTTQNKEDKGCVMVHFLFSTLSVRIFILQKMLEVRYTNCTATLEDRLPASYKVKHTLKM